MIELRKLAKTFGTRQALRDLDLNVPRGEIFGLLGHNGAGKSTAIGMMLGQVWPTSGEAVICGHSVTTHRWQALRNVGAIFEAPVFYDYLSGWRNLEILSHYTAPTSPSRIREVIDWVGLSGREKARVRTYSHGMRTRLALAQALLPGPDLLILDEPTNGLDPEGIHEMRQTILRLHREMKLTILLSSHLLSEVEQLCTRIAVLNQGCKLFDGPLSTIHEGRNWVTLKVNDFAAATALLLREKLIEATEAENLIAPAKNVGTDQIVRCLVAQDISVFEIAARERTLEDFYLSLIKAAGTHGPADAPVSASGRTKKEAR